MININSVIINITIILLILSFIHKMYTKTKIEYYYYRCTV